MAKSYRDLVAAARRTVTEIGPEEAQRHIDAGATLIDVREPAEHAAGALPGADHIPRGVLESVIPTRHLAADTEIILYCAGGHRSLLAARTLLDMGYRRVVSLAGGVGAWRNAGLPWTGPESGQLSPAQRLRYGRHLSLNEVGEAGQRRLLDSTVLLVGVGGLGSPVALYLAAAGVGRIVIVDDDLVETGNLQRQVLHSSDGVGSAKVESAGDRMQSLNPDVVVDRHRTRITAANISELMDGVDVVVDGSDNFPTRYLINDAALRTRIPVVHGAVLRFEGQVSVFRPYTGPCYRCLHPLPPPPELAPACAEVGVLGVVPGVIGTIQAVEAIKLLLDIGEPLVGRLLTYDAVDQSFMRLEFARNPDCAACGKESAPPPLVDYDWACLPATGDPGIDPDNTSSASPESR